MVAAAEKAATVQQTKTPSYTSHQARTSSRLRLRFSSVRRLSEMRKHGRPSKRLLVLLVWACCQQMSTYRRVERDQMSCRKSGTVRLPPFFENLFPPPSSIRVTQIDAPYYVPRGIHPRASILLIADDIVVNTGRFYGQIRNLRIDIRDTDPYEHVCALHYQVAQATSIHDVELIASSETTQRGMCKLPISPSMGPTYQGSEKQ